LMLSGVAVTRTRITVLAVAAMLVSVFALSAIAASDASASEPAICTQYPDLPQCQPDATDPPVAADPTAGPSADVAADNLPFTGYPLTALILLLLTLLLVGLAIRAYLAVRDRIASDRAAGP
jgi:hypothetical protein